MKRLRLSSLLMALFAVVLVFSAQANSSNTFATQQQESSAITFKGKLRNSESRQAIAHATINLSGTNISSITNSEGSFSIKIPKQYIQDGSLSINYIGFENLHVALSSLDSNDDNKIELTPLSISINTISVNPSDALHIIREVIRNKELNYSNSPLRMTTFYRETIQKGSSYVSLAEAVIDVHKQPHFSYKLDGAKVYKARKSADYSKIDTLNFKIQGGPHATLMMDLSRDPYTLLATDQIDYYNFSLRDTTMMDDREVYIIDFYQKSYIKEPLFYGSLYVDAMSMALVSANYSVNLADRDAAAQLYIKRKPMAAKVYPVKTNYMVTYRRDGDKYVYSYSRGEVVFKVNWKKRLFNSTYTSTIEMVATDSKPTQEKNFDLESRFKSYVILQDQISGFSDNAFWGDYNVIEPENSIDNAIRKIMRKLEDRNQHQ